MKVLNTWYSTSSNVLTYDFSQFKEIFRIGDYAIFKQSNESYFYIFKNIALLNLCGGNNKDIIRCLNAGYIPESGANRHLVIRALEAKEKGESILLANTIMGVK